jgi:rhodanese-related sulfurtransferase
MAKRRKFSEEFKQEAVRLTRQADRARRSGSEAPFQSRRRTDRAFKVESLRMKILSANQVEALLADGDTILIHVLDRKGFESAHIPGSWSIPISSDDFVGQVDSLVADQQVPIIVYSHGGDCDASRRAGKLLNQAGYTEVFVYLDGIRSWVAAGRRVERCTDPF